MQYSSVIRRQTGRKCFQSTDVEILSLERKVCTKKSAFILFFTSQGGCLYSLPQNVKTHLEDNSAFKQLLHFMKILHVSPFLLLIFHLLLMVAGDGFICPAPGILRNEWNLPATNSSSVEYYCSECLNCHVAAPY